MTRRNLLAAAIAIVTAAACVRLGFWQLDRLSQRREQNAAVLAQMSLAPIAVTDSLPRYRRVMLAGEWDFANEVVIAGRTHGGAPGVNIVTPLKLSSGRAVLVNRGWVYSPNAGTIDLTQWREPNPTAQPGYVDRPLERKAPPASLSARVLASLDVAQVVKRQPDPRAFFDFVVVATPTADSMTVTHPTRLSAPPLDEGPHKSYAAQWFSFAAIALVGVGVLIRQSSKPRSFNP